MSEPTNSYRVRLSATAQTAVEAIIAENGCSPQEAIDILIQRRVAPPSSGLSHADKDWIYNLIAEASRENLEMTREIGAEAGARLYAIEQGLNAIRLLLAIIFEHQGSEEQLELQRQVTELLNKVLRPLSEDPQKLLAEALDVERQKRLLLDGQFARQQEGGDGRAQDELEQDRDNGPEF